MSAAVEAQIFNALADTLDAYVAANPIGVAYPGIAFTPVAGAPYLRPWLLPAPTISTDWQRSNDYSGIFQIDVFWPAGQGIKLPMAAAAKLIDFFVGVARFSAVGSATFEKLAEDGTNTIHFVGEPPGALVGAGVQMLFSIPAKSAERRSLTLLSTDGSGNVQCEFDLAAGLAGAATGCTPAIRSIGNGEFLLSVSWTMAFSANPQFVLILTQAVGGPQSYVGTPGAGVLIGRAGIVTNGVAVAFDMIGGTTNGASVSPAGPQPDDYPVTVQIVDPPYLSPAQQEPGWLQIPVNVRYRAFASAPGLQDLTIGMIEALDTAAFLGTVV